MKYAVIRADGFIGSRIVEALHLGDAHSVVAISPHASDHILAARFYVDLRSASPGSVPELSKALERCSVAIHAGQDEPESPKRLVTTFVRAGSSAGTRRMIYVSTPAPWLAEESGPESRSVARSSSGDASTMQDAAERQFLSECSRAGIIGFALRTGIVYGPRSPLIADVIEELRDGNAWLLEGGTGIFNGIYVDNLIAAIRLCFKAKQGASSALYVGDAETVTWRDLYHAIARNLELSASRIKSRPSLEVVASEPFFRGCTPRVSDTVRFGLQLHTAKVSSVDATKVIGYSPTTTFRDAVQRTCAWWRFAEGDWQLPASASQ